jgi:hypothetical protein
MVAPTPSLIRVVRIYAGNAGPNAGLLGPNAILAWPPKHPLDVDWWWIDATVYCADIDDVLGSFTPTDAFFTGGDGGMTILAVALAPSGLMAGVRVLGGTPGVTYIITVILNGSLGANVKSLDISLLCSGDLPLGALSPWLADFSNANNSGSYYYL